MTVFRTVNLLCLALSLSSAGAPGILDSPEAMTLSDPITCYILDGVLLLYCIIFTALYFRTKFSRQFSNTRVPDEVWIRWVVQRNGDQNADEYQTLELQGSQPTRRNRAQQEESQYEALSSPTNDEYQEIAKKSKPRKSKRKAKESEAIAMEPVPPLPSRS